MTYEQVLNYFGSSLAISRKCGFSVSTPYVWRYRGFIPLDAQHKIEKLSNGDLKADYAHAGRIK